MVFNWFKRQHSEPDGDSEPTPQVDQASAQTSAEAKETAVNDGDANKPSDDASPDDQLNEQLKWAKLALETIKKRQQAAAAASESANLHGSEDTASVLEAITPALEGAVSIAEPSAETVEPALVGESIAPPVEVSPLEPSQTEVGETAPSVTDPMPTIAAPEVERDSDPVVLAAPPGSASLDPLTAAIEPTPTTPETNISAPQTDVPIWMQAAADREAKLERLRATAIDAEDPKPLQARVTTPMVETPAPEPDSLPDLASEFVLDEGFLWSSEVLAAQGRKAEDISLEEITWLKRLRQGLDRTRRSLVNQLKAIVGQGPLNQDAVESIEELLLQADVGFEATDRIIQALQQKLREEVLPPDQAISYLKGLLRDMLDNPVNTGNITLLAPEKDTLNIWLITGVNGAGKTTTIGKLAHIATKSGYKCLIAAADTFRAAAVEQVKIWGKRSNVEVIANPGKNTDPAAVVYDAIAAAEARGTELLLVDTAGRLQNKKNLMDELSKIRRIIDKKATNAQIQAFLVLDASLGQNGVRQAEVFLEAAQLNGVILTKLDGTAKGGVALAVVQQLGLPIRFIGAGEGIEDLRPFSSYEFVEALLSG